MANKATATATTAKQVSILTIQNQLLQAMATVNGPTVVLPYTVTDSETCTLILNHDYKSKKGMERCKQLLAGMEAMALVVHYTVAGLTYYQFIGNGSDIPANVAMSSFIDAERKGTEAAKLEAQTARNRAKSLQDNAGAVLDAIAAHEATDILGKYNRGEISRADLLKALQSLQ